MKIEYLEAGEQVSRETIGRASMLNSEVTKTAETIIANVRAEGDAALMSYTQQFDHATRKSLAVSPMEIETAVKQLKPDLNKALVAAATAIRDFHQRQLQQSWFVTRPDGALVGSRVLPLESVGIYIPGGQAAYPSTVLMTALVAQVAGVARIVIVTPPRPDGTVSPAVLAAAKLAGVNEIYAVGGAQAIAALAYGTQSIAPVDKIVGPGNSYVAAAKRLVFGDVGIDMIAGPSEVAILADESSDAGLVAIDLLAQAEHDPDARTYLVTTDEVLVDEVIERIEFFLTDSTRQEKTKASIDKNCLVLVCPDLPTAISAVNDIAPEHLEILMDGALELLGLIENAGAVFCGPWTPESVGDYIAGPNHTLPTAGTARFSSPLSIEDFTKRSSVISYSYSALENDAKNIQALATAEGLWAHERAVSLRFEDE